MLLLSWFSEAVHSSNQPCLILNMTSLNVAYRDKSKYRCLPTLENLWSLLTFSIYYSFSARKEMAIYTKNQQELCALATQGVTDPLKANVQYICSVNTMIMLVDVGCGRDSLIKDRQLKKNTHICANVVLKMTSTNLSSIVVQFLLIY